ncbi:MAG: hypothetical protein ABI835_03465 [Chloroflexota bacterium]
MLLVAASTRNAELLIVCAGVIAVPFALDAYVFYRIIDSLKTGHRR